jgi:hypothetical protein
MAAMWIYRAILAATAAVLIWYSASDSECALYNDGTYESCEILGQGDGYCTAGEGSEGDPDCIN